MRARQEGLRAGWPGDGQSGSRSARRLEGNSRRNQGGTPPRAREPPESHGGFGESDWLGSYLLCEEGFGFGGIGFVPRVRFFGGFGFGRIGFSPDVLAMSQI